MNKEYVIKVLENNGIDSSYLEEMNSMIEGGGDEWMDVVSEIIGKSSYDDSNWLESDYDKIDEFMKVLSELNIELI